MSADICGRGFQRFSVSSGTGEAERKRRRAETRLTARAHFDHCFLVL
jgi:hypothetical protein